MSDIASWKGASRRIYKTKHPGRRRMSGLWREYHQRTSGSTAITLNVSLFGTKAGVILAIAPRLVSRQITARYIASLYRSGPAIWAPAPVPFPFPTCLARLHLQPLFVSARRLSFVVGSSSSRPRFLYAFSLFQKCFRSSHSFLLSSISLSNKQAVDLRQSRSPSPSVSEQYRKRFGKSIQDSGLSLYSCICRIRTTSCGSPASRSLNNSVIP